jgi:hypothetical protein
LTAIETDRAVTADVAGRRLTLEAHTPVLLTAPRAR